MNPVTCEISLFDRQKHALAGAVLSVYLAKLFVLRVRRYCPGDDEFKKGQAFESWEKSVFTSKAMASIKARGKSLLRQGAEVTIEAIPAIALGNRKATLLITDLDRNGLGIPDLPLRSSLHEVALKVSDGPSTTMAWVTVPNFPVAEMPFEAEQIMGVISVKNRDRTARSRPVHKKYILDNYVAILGRCIQALQTAP